MRANDRRSSRERECIRESTDGGFLLAPFGCDRFCERRTVCAVPLVAIINSRSNGRSSPTLTSIGAGAQEGRPIPARRCEFFFIHTVAGFRTLVTSMTGAVALAF